MVMLLAGLATVLSACGEDGPPAPANGPQASQAAAQAPPMPNWASFEQPEQFDRFIDLVRQDFKERGIPIRIEGAAVVVVNDPDGLRYGLRNLAARCRYHDPKHWPKVIAAHFDRQERHRLEGQAIARSRSQFDAVEPFLAVRFRPADYFDYVPEQSVAHRTDLPGVVTTLVYCIESTHDVHPRDVGDWGKTQDDVFALALTKAAAAAESPEPHVAIETGVTKLGFTIITSDRSIAAAVIERIGQELRHRHGMLLAVPSDHMAYVYRIEDKQVTKAFQVLGRQVIDDYRTSPDPVSPHVYWVRNRKVVQVRLDVTSDGEILPDLPQDFVAMYHALPEAADAGRQ